MIRILAVDDMKQWREYHTSALTVILKDIPFELVVNSSATEALQTIEATIDSPFNLIITDLQMETDYEPEYAGEWLIRNVQTYKPYQNIPKIIVSAAYNIKYIAEQLNVGFLAKPQLINNPLAYELKIKEILNC